MQTDYSKLIMLTVGLIEAALIITALVVTLGVANKYGDTISESYAIADKNRAYWEFSKYDDNDISDADASTCILQYRGEPAIEIRDIDNTLLQKITPATNLIYTKANIDSITDYNNGYHATVLREYDEVVAVVLQRKG